MLFCPLIPSGANPQAKVLIPNAESGTKLSKQRLPRPRVQEHKLKLESEHPKRFIVLSLRVLAASNLFAKKGLKQERKS
jgi:hypothetical protein